MQSHRDMVLSYERQKPDASFVIDEGLSRRKQAWIAVAIIVICSAILVPIVQRLRGQAAKAATNQRPVPTTVILYFALAGHFPQLRGWQVAMTAGMFMMGFGAIHEIMEYVTYLVLGEERGMLKPSTSYFLDTQRDLTNNLFGTLTALALIAITRRK